MTRGFLPLLAFVIAIGVATLAWGTDGFQVVTTAGARRLAVAHHPRAIPDVALIDQDGTPFSFDSYRGKPLLVDFIYTSCPTICGVLGEDFHEILAAMREARGAQRVDLLSISFDPTRDGEQALQSYAARYGAAVPHWRIAVPATQGGLRALLKSFGVVVIPDQFGGFTHNAGIYVLDPRGRLVRILDPGAPAAVVEQVVHSVS